MSIAIVKAEQRATENYFEITLDDTKVVNGAPDPQYVRSFSWGTDVDPVDAKREMLLICQGELDRLMPAAPALRKDVTITLPGDGGEVVVKHFDIPKDMAPGVVMLDAPPIPVAVTEASAAPTLESVEEPAQ